MSDLETAESSACLATNNFRRLRVGGPHVLIGLLLYLPNAYL